MTACSGNWRNSLYITCQDRTDNPGYLLASDRDGQPVIISVQQFYQLTEVWIDPAECCGRLTEAGFESLYAIVPALERSLYGGATAAAVP